jgi:hypothetical protein
MKGLWLLLLLCSCAGNADDHMEDKLDTEIRERLRLAAKLARKDPSMRSVGDVHRRVNDFMLLSKDAENPGAAVVLSNAFFQRYFDSLGIPDRNRQQLQEGMGKRTVAVALRSNELQVMNRIIMANQPDADILLRPVSE